MLRKMISLLRVSFPTGTSNWDVQGFINQKAKSLAFHASKRIHRRKIFYLLLNRTALAFESRQTGNICERDREQILRGPSRSRSQALSASSLLPQGFIFRILQRCLSAHHSLPSAKRTRPRFSPFSKTTPISVIRRILVTVLFCCSGL